MSGQKITQFLRDWTLIIAIVSGIAGYFIYTSIPALASTHAWMYEVVTTVQPALIFVMLFLTFCRVSPRSIRLCRWHLWLLLFQCACFAAIAIVLILLPHSGLRIVLEGALLCLICPTATAAAVVTRKLGGDVAHITTYTILINLAVAILIPLTVPYIHPNAAIGVWNATLLILGKVFPLLLLPLVAAWLLRLLLPKVCRKVASFSDLGFYIWAVSLALALAVTTRSFMHSHIGFWTAFWLVIVSAVSCVMQFWLGRKVGSLYSDKVTAGQALGQKNTVLVIWMGYTFFSPVTSIVGGFYSIWHNVINSWQLYHHTHPHK